MNFENIKSINFAFKATYYLYIHPNEKLNPHYKFFKNCHRIVCLIFFVFILSSFFCPSLGHTSSYAKMFIGCILALVFMIGFIGLIVVSQIKCIHCLQKVVYIELSHCINYVVQTNLPSIHVTQIF